MNNDTVLFLVTIVLCILLLLDTIYIIYHKKQFAILKKQIENPNSYLKELKSCVPYDAEDIATYIIDYTNVVLHTSINSWKLNCILYIIQGVYLKRGDECFYNEIETCPICPIVNTVYQKYLKYGSTGIISFEMHDTPLEENDKKQINRIITKVYNKDTYTLCTTLKKQTPFIKHYDVKNEPEYTEIIPKNEIKDYFIKFVHSFDKKGKTTKNEIYHAPYDVFEVCDYLIQIIAESGHTVNALKLNALLFFAQGIYLATFDMPLFKEDFEAWDCGPIIPIVWRRFKKYGNCSIHLTKYEYCLQKEDEIFLYGIVQNFGPFQATPLFKLIRNQNEYKKAKQDSTKIISKQIIKESFLAD